MSMSECPRSCKVRPRYMYSCSVGVLCSYEGSAGAAGAHDRRRDGSLRSLDLHLERRDRGPAVVVITRPVVGAQRIRCVAAAWDARRAPADAYTIQYTTSVLES